MCLHVADVDAVRASAVLWAGGARAAVGRDADLHRPLLPHHDRKGNCREVLNMIDPGLRDLMSRRVRGRGGVTATQGHLISQVLVNRIR